MECTVNRVENRFHSQLARRSRNERLADLERVASLGIRRLRFPLLWEELAPDDPEKIDWSFADLAVERLRALGIRPIVGLVHHGSGPRYTSLLDPRFPQLLARFARAVAERYPDLDAFTPVNEPLTTARFSGLYGHWYPHARDPLSFCRALLTQIRAVVLAMREVRAVNPAAQLVQTEDLGETFGSPGVAYQAEFENERRWLPFDLLAGALRDDSPAAHYLRWAGIPERELAAFAEKPCPPDIVGINHYVTSSRFLDEDFTKYAPERHGGNGREVYADVEAVRARPEGSAEPTTLLRQAWARYGRPVAVTEAHVDCTREEQLRWFAEIWNSAQAARNEGSAVVAVTAWSLFGAYDWNSLLTVAAGNYESGAFDLRSAEPRPTALAGLLRNVSKTGECRHPLLGAAGWWRRRVRFLPDTPGYDPTDRRQVRTVFTPPASHTGAAPCPMLLITGASGTLGQAFARICYLRGLPYRLLTRGEMDIADGESVKNALRAFSPWAVVNAAGYVRVDDAEQDRERCFRENAQGPGILAAACAERSVRLVSFSSDLVFDGRKDAPYLESDPVAPLNVYGESKAAAERGIANASQSALVVRTSAFFSPWDAHNFVTQTLEKLAAGEPVIAAEDLVISPTYVPDLVHAALNLLIDGEHGLWHLANSGSVSWAEFARTVAFHSGHDPALVWGCPSSDLNFRAPRPRQTALHSQRGQLLNDWRGALDRYFQERRDAAHAPATQPCGANEPFARS